MNSLKMPKLSSLLLPIAAGAPTAYAAVSKKNSMTNLPGFVTDKDLPQMSGNADWMSALPGLQFQLNDFTNEDEETARKLRSIRERVLWGQDQNSMQFINGDETYYSDYSQAWRMLGMYIDCNSPYQHEGDCYGDQDDEYSEVPCMRYLMWAAVSILGFGKIDRRAQCLLHLRPNF